MKLRGIRVGMRFVLEDRGGLWEKLSETRARCVFGSRDDYGREIEVDPDAFVFGLFNSDRSALARDGAGIKVVIVDSDTDEIMAEYADANVSMVTALAAVEGLRFRLPRKNRKRDYLVMETMLDVNDGVLCVVVREDKVIGREEVPDEEAPEPAPEPAREEQVQQFPDSPSGDAMQGQSGEEGNHGGGNGMGEASEEPGGSL